MLKLSERGIIQLLLPLILLAGIIGGVYLITSGNPLKLFSKASNPPIVFQKADGSTLPLNAQGIPQSTANGFRVLLTSTLGPPATGGVSKPISGPVSTGTVSFKVAETPTDLTNEVYIPYTTEPMVVGFTFKDQKPGVKFLWVEFKDNTGKTDRKSGQLEIVAAPSGGTGTNAQRVFITSTRYNGNLGGLAGADAKCQDSAKAANLGGTWKAWLSDSNTSASSRLAHSSGPYKLLDGTTIAAIQNPKRID